MSKKESGEDFVIRALTADQPNPSWVKTGPGDDAAILADDQVLTTDMMVQDVHFDQTLSPEDLAWKLIAVNASDVAACGALPTWAMLSIALPEPLDRTWSNRFSKAFRLRLGTLDIALIGGDTTRSSGPLVLNLCMAGKLNGPALLRSGAQASDDIWVSGVLGDASGGFHLKHPILRQRFERPCPPLELGPALAKAQLATAAMDLSDGLIQDLTRLCAASNCGAVVDSNILPASEELRQATENILPHQVTFGEDYQLLFTANPTHRGAIESLGRTRGIRLTRIGEISRKLGLEMPGCDTMKVWTHFQEHPS
jgi:thiamine-monophosphate kinase